MSGIGRRDTLKLMGGGALLPALAAAQQGGGRGRAVTKGRLKQSVSRWCYKKIPMPEFCKAVAEMGLPAIDLLEEKEWPVAREYGLVCSMGYARRRHDPRRAQRQGQPRRDRRRPRRAIPPRPQAEACQRHHVLRQPQAAWPTPRRSPTASPA